MDTNERNQLIAQVRELKAKTEYLEGRNLALSITVQDLSERVAALAPKDGAPDETEKERVN
ncbi:hypothetical protein [Paenirhodobacter enshiensis]|uniref:Uncharacterized protein n=1 Tax=Paenirhodobacter enshiensis TaxID=1105367 RepID=A0A086XQM1_9RHOB|nr:hypothetical protein [Paenirhodobacter enshiensis]KFI24321.1 hypothetical protein CG50_10740 [Paenirhodobacter enshiensis]